jgi:hypothetical protein
MLHIEHPKFKVLWSQNTDNNSLNTEENTHLSFDTRVPRGTCLVCSFPLTQLESLHLWPFVPRRTYWILMAKKILIMTRERERR